MLFCDSCHSLVGIQQSWLSELPLASYLLGARLAVGRYKYDRAATTCLAN
jgi:hypothetical protein